MYYIISIPSASRKIEKFERKKIEKKIEKFPVLNPSDRAAQLVERRSSNSKVAGSRPSRGRQHLSACAGYGNYIIHTLEHFHLNILRSVQ